MLSEKENKLLEKVLGKNAEVVSPLMGGMMNVSYIVKDSKGKKYILYLPTEQANEMVNRALEKEHQKIVYSLGITSKNVFFDADNNIISKEDCFLLQADKSVYIAFSCCGTNFLI